MFVVVGEHRRGGTDLGAHVADGRLAGGAEIESAPGPMYSTIAPVPPSTVSISGDLQDDVLRADQPDRVPVSFTPMTLGQRTFHGKPVITSTASAPPTPMATMPSPPAFGVWLSVPIIMPPGNA